MDRLLSSARTRPSAALALVLLALAACSEPPAPPAPECTKNEQCKDGKACVAERCLSCTSDAQCGGLSCVVGACKAPACDDTVKNGAETDVDCGGACAARCADTKGCSGPSDCASGVCNASQCRPATCGDAVKNGAETDVDCGADCGPCADGKVCAATTDCASGVCANGACQVPSCTDEVKNGDEAAMDCGGSCPAKCGDGAACGTPADCTSGVCTDSSCRAATCADAVKNGDEADVDCGGACPSRCADGKACAATGDCASGVCEGGRCLVATCDDKVKNGSETAVDCGGACAAKCGDGAACSAATDCGSGVCESNVCQASACDDGVKNGTETDTDCGPGCLRCASGKACSAGTHCASGTCFEGACAPRVTIGSFAPTGNRVSTIARVVIPFSENVDAATIESNVAVAAVSGPDIPYRYVLETSSKVATITFDKQLPFEAEFKVTVRGGTAGVKATTGALLEPGGTTGSPQDFEWTFRTRSAGDQNPWTGTTSSGAGWSHSTQAVDASGTTCTDPQAPGCKPKFRMFTVTGSSEPVGASKSDQHSLESGFVGATHPRP